MGSQKKLFVVIPAYQASLTLESVFNRIPSEIYDRGARIIVVNDGSSDDTAEVAARIALSRPNVEVIEHPQNKGYAQAQKTGFSLRVATTGRHRRLTACGRPIRARASAPVVSSSRQ